MDVGDLSICVGIRDETHEKNTEREKWKIRGTFESQDSEANHD